MANKEITILVMGSHGDFDGIHLFVNLFSPENKDVTDPNDIECNNIQVTFPLDGYNVHLRLATQFNGTKDSEQGRYDQVQRYLEECTIERGRVVERFDWILYFHRPAPNQNPTALIDPIMQRTIKYLTKKNSFSNLIICTTNWVGIAPIKGQRIAAALNKYLQDLVNQGARIEHMKNRADQSIGPATEFLKTVLHSDPGEVESIPRPPFPAPNDQQRRRRPPSPPDTDPEIIEERVRSLMDNLRNMPKSESPGCSLDHEAFMSVRYNAQPDT